MRRAVILGVILVGVVAVLYVSGDYRGDHRSVRDVERRATVPREPATVHRIVLDGVDLKRSADGLWTSTPAVNPGDTLAITVYLKTESPGSVLIGGVQVPYTADTTSVDLTVTLRDFRTMEALPVLVGLRNEGVIVLTPGTEWPPYVLLHPLTTAVAGTETSVVIRTYDAGGGAVGISVAQDFTNAPDAPRFDFDLEQTAGGVLLTLLFPAAGEYEFVITATDSDGNTVDQRAAVAVSEGD